MNIWILDAKTDGIMKRFVQFGLDSFHSLFNILIIKILIVDQLSK